MTQYVIASGLIYINGASVEYMRSVNCKFFIIEMQLFAIIPDGQNQSELISLCVNVKKC